MGTYDLRRFAGPELLAQAAAQDWLEESSLSPSSPGKGIFSTALSGGRIARNFFSALATQVIAQKRPLGHVHFFWSDERCVPPSDAESNFLPAHELLFEPLNIPANQIHRIQGEKPPEQAVADAEAELRRFLPHENPPKIDLVMLGMGEDGHVASLFPQESESRRKEPAVFRPVKAVKPPPMRITMGYPVIAAARQVWVLASGPGKEPALRQSLLPNGPTPLARVLALRGHTRIYSDCHI